MARRLGSLKTRTALSIAAVIAVVLTANAVYLILDKRKELRQDIEERATTFAELSTGPICAAYDAHYASGRYKFQELLRDTMRLNPDVVRVQLLGVGGQVIYDSRELEEAGAPGPDRWHEPERLEALKRLEPTLLRDRDPGRGERLAIVVPYVEEWGRHRISAAYEVSYQALRPRIVRLVYTTGGLTLLSILAAAVVAVALSTRITRPLEQLTQGAQHIAEGRLERSIDVRSGDELQVLADAFNNMAVGLRENIQKLEESNRKLAAANEDLKELDRMKSDLLANVSHELRTPLTAIKGYTDYILERKLGPVGPKQEKGLVVVQRNLDRLSRSISALLDFSRMDAGRVPLNIAPFGLASLLEGVATGLRSETERKRLSLELRLAADLPPVIGDREKLSAVFENLIVNAIKFTPAGGQITVAAARMAAGAERPRVEVRVADTGIGIPADQLEKVFQRFHQVDSSTTRRFGGVGLGLAIVKSILDAHDSPISVESRLDVGTVFRFTLPVLERQEPVPGPERVDVSRPADGNADPAEPAVLVLHGGQETMARIRDTLVAEGFRPVVAVDAGQALQALARERPAAVIVDGAPGWEAAESIREAMARSGGQVPMLSIGADGAAADLHELLATLRREMERPPDTGTEGTTARTRT